MEKRSRLRGAIFDLDGTLLDSMWVWEQIDRDFLRERGLPFSSDYAQAIAAMSFRQAAEYTAARFKLTESVEEIMSQWNQMAFDAYCNRIGLKPGAFDFLLSLKERGISLSVATASHPQLYEAALSHHGILSLFDSFTTLQEVSRGKGFPDIYWKAAEKMKFAPGECCVFEDLYQGILGAKAGGFYTVGVYDPSSQGDWDRIREEADFTFKEFSQGLSLLSGLLP